MSIQKWFSTTFTIKRQVWSGESSGNVTQGTFLGHIQQGTPKNMQQNIGFRFSKAYTIWCPPETNIQEGDRIEEGGNEYDTRFVTDRNIGTSGHLELIVEKL